MTVYCSKCGGQVSEGTAFCPACGQPTRSVAPQISASQTASSGASRALGQVASAVGHSATASGVGQPAAFAGGPAAPALGAPGAGAPSYPAAGYTAAPISNSRVEFAGFWLRVVAYLIDGFILGVAFSAWFIPFARMTGLIGAMSGIHPGADPKDVGALLGGTFF